MSVARRLIEEELERNAAEREEAPPDPEALLAEVRGGLAAALLLAEGMRDLNLPAGPRDIDALCWCLHRIAEAVDRLDGAGRRPTAVS